MTSQNPWPYKRAAPAAGQEAVAIGHAYGYDRHGNLTSFTDGEGVETTFGYDGLDRRVSEVAPGALGAEGDSDAQPEVTRFAFDSNGNLTARETPRGTRSEPDGDYSFDYEFDSLDRLKSEANPEGEEWTYAYDVAGNRVSETSPRGNAAEPAPDGGSFDTTFEYDAADRLASQADGLGFETAYGYDADSNLARVVAPGAKDGRRRRGRGPGV